MIVVGPRWTGLLFLGLVVAMTTSSIAQEKVIEPAAKPGCWVPRYLCLAPPCCPKPMPPLPCSHFRTTCDRYCPKPIPCFHTPCLKYTCDHYQCKPAPCCLPAPLCEPYCGCQKH